MHSLQALALGHAHAGCFQCKSQSAFCSSVHQRLCMLYQVVLEASDSSSGLKNISEMLPDRWQNDFWRQQLPQNYHQMRERNVPSMRHLHANASQVTQDTRPVLL